jgi:electron transport complex protein RnfG
MDHLTREPIAMAHKAKVEKALKAVLPDFDNSPAEEGYWVVFSENDSLLVHPAKKNGQWVGSAVESNSMQGFSGEIKVVVGLDTQGKIINYKVLEHAETPGLGDKMESWFRSDKNRQNVLGKDLSRSSLKVTKDNGDIDAITGATISSRAFLETLNRAYSAISKYEPDAASGATESASNESDNEKGGEK